MQYCSSYLKLQGSKEGKNMDNRSDEQFIIMKNTIEANKQKTKSNKQDSDEKIMKLTEYFKAMLT